MSNQPTPRILTPAQAKDVIHQNAKNLDMHPDDLSRIAGHDNAEQWATSIVERNRNDRIAQSDEARGPGF